MRVAGQIPHRVFVRTEIVGGVPTYRPEVSCPYEAASSVKPCRIHGSEGDVDGTTEPGCWVQQCLDAAGDEAVVFVLPKGGVLGWWKATVHNCGQDLPTLLHVDFDGVAQ